MLLPKYIISCDWGTTNFRLRLVKTDVVEIVAEINTDQGIKNLYSQFLKQNKLNQKDFFSNYLISQIELLHPDHQEHLIVSAGMISSNIGLCELDYAQIPFHSNGKNLKSKRVLLKNKQNLLIISGVKNQHGMMRGEETQAIGLENLLLPYKEGILILPGTHSKHLSYKNEKFVNLKNFMTGELFQMLMEKSILSNSIKKATKDVISEEIFLEGVKLGSKGRLSASLFSIRARHILDNARPEENYYFLSGLLIGDELSYLKNENQLVFLASPLPIMKLYKIAIEHIVGKTRAIIFEAKIVEKAMLKGQLKILLNNGI